MAWTSNRPIMASADLDMLFKSVWDVLDTRLAWALREDNDKELFAAKFLAGKALLDFIAEHPIEFLDLLARGKGDDSVRHYITLNGFNGNVQGYVRPYIYDGILDRELTPREIYYAPVGKEKEKEE